MKKNIGVGVIILTMLIFIGIYIYKTHTVDFNEGKISINKKNDYDASEEIEKTLESINYDKKAEVITNINTSSDVLALSFEGMTNSSTMKKILDLLDKYNIKATFFITGIKAAEDPTIVKRIKESGHTIGSETLSGRMNMETLENTELAEDFSRSNKILSTITGNEINLLKCRSTIYSDDLLAIAYAAGNKYVINNDNYLSYQSFKDYEQAYGYIKNIKNGSIISIKVEGVLDKDEYKEKKEEEPSIDKQPNITEDKDKDLEQVDIAKTVEWLLKSIDENKKSLVKIEKLYSYKNDMNLAELEIKNTTVNIEEKNDDLQTNTTEKNEEITFDFNELIEKNNKKLSPTISEVYTTYEALSYTFRGISNEVVLDGVLSLLEKINAKGTFFVTKAEINNYPDRITKIISKGHEVGNGGITSDSKLLNSSIEEICKEIYEVDKLLESKGINTNAYMAGYGYSNSKIQEAVSVITNMDSLKNYELFTYSKAPIINKYSDMSAEDVVSNYFNTNSYVSLKKGEIVYFRLDSNLFIDENTIPKIIELLTENYVEKGYAHKYNEETKLYDLIQKNLGYEVTTISELQNTNESDERLGRYKINNNNNLLEKRNYEDAINLIKTNYIGNKEVDLGDFNNDEQSIMDKSGLINTKGENVIFFTFDDWGGDPIINEILDVLDKHKVKGSFFAVAKYTDINSGISNANPNLLRTIALHGHDIGSHNYDHELLDVGKDQLEPSLIKSYQVMGNVIGDLNSLRPYFRPPTLLLKREGLTAVFESGFKYSISGNISTHDYDSTSAQQIVDYIEGGLVRNEGNIVVMHMNNQSYFTAEALDIFLTNNENGLYGEKYKIARLSDYLEK